MTSSTAANPAAVPSGPADSVAVVTLCALRAEPLSVDEVLDAVADPACGAQVLFLGRIRDHDHEQGVAGLDYEAHPSAVTELASICAEVAEAYDVRRVAAVHRTGSLVVGEVAVIVAVAAAHRGSAFEAGRVLIDRLKASVPIWKHQVFTDGDSEWVGLP